MTGPQLHLEPLIRSLPAWVHEQGPHQEFILTSRVRLARNLDKVPFPGEALKEQRSQVLNRVVGALPKTPELSSALAFDLSGSDKGDLQFLNERRLISGEMAGKAGQGVLVGSGESVSIMINEEDHLRIQGVQPGKRLEEALSSVSAVDERIEGYLNFAYTDEWGYLTSCPTNVGTGMRASVLAHFPGLVLTRRIGKLMQGATAMNMAVRGFHGEGSEIMGNFVQISNQITLGMGEREIIGALDGLVTTLISEEERAVEFMCRTARISLEDKIYRAWGLLTEARSIGSQEVLSLTSAVRLGLRLQLPGLCDLGTLNELLVCTQPEHLVRAEGKDLSEDERRVKRAELIRTRLKASQREQARSDRGSTNGEAPQ